MLRNLLAWVPVCGAGIANAAQMGAADLPDYEPVQVVIADAPPTTPFIIGERWSMGGNFGARIRYDRSAQDSGNTAEAVTLLPQGQFALLYDDPGYFRFFTSIKAAKDVLVHSSPSQSARDMEMELDEFYARWQSTPALSVTLGRARMTDSRNWIYGNSENKNDSLQILYRDRRRTLQFSIIGKDVFPRDLMAADVLRESVNFVGVYEQSFMDALRVSAFALVQDDETPGKKADRRYAGLRARGTLLGHFRYWADTIFLRGRASGQNLRANAFDTGLVYTAPVWSEPRVVLSYAHGSGDPEPGDGADGRFHPTGLGDNKHQYGGVSRFKYYGEALDPALSNLHVFTVATGARFSERQSLDLVYHQYILDTSSDALYASGFNQYTTGPSRDVGDSLDVIYGYKDRNAFEIELLASFFRPGSAFAVDLDDNVRLGFRVKYNFSPRKH